jgi:hypothetical protein
MLHIVFQAQLGKEANGSMCTVVDKICEADSPSSPCSERIRRLTGR